MIHLRDYQLRAVEAVFHEWENARSTLVVQPTGTGKTTVFTEIIKRCQPERAIILAHREELIFQAKERVEKQAGLSCAIEMANERADKDIFRPDVIVATIQTLISGRGDIRRMHNFSPHDFGLLVIDEGHHSTATSYRKVIEHFSQNPDLKILGVTATPDRADEEALGQIFETVADVYEILDAIHDGWLVPVDQTLIEIEDLDFSQVRTTAGDLNFSDLSSVMEAEKVLQGVCGATIKEIGNKQTIVFTTSVKHAEMACEIFNRHRVGMAAWICGKTNKESRRDTMRRFHAGEIQVMCNVGCITEGVDVPRAEIAVMARPTESRSLYAQMAGRILRPLSGLVDRLPDGDSRKSAIAQSAKPSALIIDFAGNSGRHKLITSADILGGNVSEQVRELALRKVMEANGPVRMNDALDEAEHEMELLRKQMEERRLLIQARQAHLMAKVKYQSRQVDPFNAFDMMPRAERGWDTGKRLTEKQRELLAKAGLNPDQFSYAHACQLIAVMIDRWRRRLATVKQCAFLKSKGYQGDTKELTKAKASQLIDAIKQNGWRLPVGI